MNIFHRKRDHGREVIAVSTPRAVILWGLALIACLMPGLVAQPVLAQSTGMDPEAVLHHLDTAISWYRHLSNVDTSAGSPSDVLYLQNARTQALQAVQFAFQSAQEEAALIQKEPAAPTEATAAQSPDQGRITKAQTRVAGRIEQARKSIEALNRRIKAAGGKKRTELLGERDRLQGQLDLDRTLQEGLSKMTGFIRSNDNTGLAGRITALKASVPELASATAVAKPASQQIAKSNRAYSSGLIGQVSVLLSEMNDLRVIDELLSETERLRSTAEGLQGPLRTLLRGLMREGRDSASQSTTRSQPGSGQEKLQSIIARFKQVSAVSLPLREEIVLLDQVRASLLEWRKSIKGVTGT